MPHRSVYSYRAKLGLITPPTNTVNEAEWARMVLEGVTVHSHRMPIHAAGQGGHLMDDLVASARLIAQADVDVVAYACTAGSMVTPASSLPDEASRQCGVPVISTAASIVEALRQRRGARCGCHALSRRAERA